MVPDTPKNKQLLDGESPPWLEKSASNVSGKIGIYNRFLLSAQQNVDAS